MTLADSISLRRLSAQGIASPQNLPPEQIVSGLAAIQGQDYAGGKWSIGLRLSDATNQTIEQAIESKQLLRTWAMRGTLHFVAGVDIRWLLQLTAGRTITRLARRYRELGLDNYTLALSCNLLTKSLAENRQLSRSECYALLEGHGISTEGQRGIFILQRACLEGLICQGAVRGKDPLFFNIDDSFAPQSIFSREEALAELALRYFTTRGPATMADFVWWSGLSVAEAKIALDSIKPQLDQVTYNDQPYWQGKVQPQVSGNPIHAYLLPGFDEYLISYKDRSASLDDPLYQRITPTNGQLPATLVLDGKVVGTWRRKLTKKSIEIELALFTANRSLKSALFLPAEERYGWYLGLPVSIHSHETSQPNQMI